MLLVTRNKNIYGLWVGISTVFNTGIQWSLVDLDTLAPRKIVRINEAFG
jgi:hypothetical protein